MLAFNIWIKPQETFGNWAVTSVLPQARLTECSHTITSEPWGDGIVQHLPQAWLLLATSLPPAELQHWSGRKKENKIQQKVTQYQHYCIALSFSKSSCLFQPHALTQKLLCQELILAVSDIMVCTARRQMTGEKSTVTSQSWTKQFPLPSATSLTSPHWAAFWGSELLWLPQVLT